MAPHSGKVCDQKILKLDVTIAAKEACRTQASRRTACRTEMVKNQLIILPSQISETENYIPVHLFTHFLLVSSCSILNYLHLPMNWLCNFVIRQKLLKILWPRYSTQWFREDNMERGGSREKKQRKAETNMRERHHKYILYNGNSK